MRHSLILLLVSALCGIGCATTRPLAKFEALSPLQNRPEVFSKLQDTVRTIEATIKLKAPGLRGKATGIVRHASGGEYLVELYGRGKLFLKVYFTPAQTILWPAAGMPEIYGLDEIPTLNIAVHSRLPKWHLDDVLPVPYTRKSVDDSIWAAGGSDNRQFMQHIIREDCVPIVKEFHELSGNLQFPYKKVVLATETGSAKLVWSLHHAGRK